MKNEQWLMEWVDSSHIRTFRRVSEDSYEMIRPLGNNVFDVQEAKKEDYVRYWTAWTRYSGYTEQKKADLCIVCSEGINVNVFLDAARSEGIHIASPTEWSVQNVLEYLEHSERYGKTDASESSPARIDLDDGTCLVIHSGDGGDFAPSDIREFSAPIADLEDEPKPEIQDNDTSSANALEAESQEIDTESQATTKEVREAIRRIAGAQCRTIDDRR